MVGWHDVVLDHTLVAVADGHAFPRLEPTIPAAATCHEPASDTRFEALLRHYAGLLRRTILRVCPRDMGLSCDDIEQEARISLLESDEEREGHRLTRLVCLQSCGVSDPPRHSTGEGAPRGGHCRGARRAGPVGPVGCRVSALGSWMRECRLKISTALSRLAENRRRAVELHLQGLTTREIGDILAWSEPKARNLVHRGLKDLRN